MSNEYSKICAADHARQHNGNNYNYQTTYYPIRQRRSDQTLFETGRNQALLKAAAEGQTHRVRKLIHDGADVDFAEEETGFTALHHAVLSGWEDMVDELVEFLLHHSHVSCKEILNFFKRASIDRVQWAGFQIQFGADINSISSSSLSPLSLAALKARLNIVNQLLDRRASLVRRDGSCALLHMASFTGDATFVQSLLLKESVRQQVDVKSRIELRNVADFLGLPHAAEVADACLLPLHVAAFFGHGALIGHFLDLGVDVDALYEVTFDCSILSGDDKLVQESKWTSAMASTRNGHQNTVALLLQKGGNGQAETSHGETVITMAAVRGHAHCVSQLIDWHKERGLDWNQPGRWTPLKAAGVGCYVECVETLIRNGDDLNGIKEDSTALMDAAANGYTEYVRALIELGADLTLVNSEGNTVCHFAASGDNYDCLRALSDAGANLNSRNIDRDTPLALAAGHGKNSAVQALLELGARRNTFNNEGWRPLHHAAISGHVNCITTLRGYGVSLESVDKSKGQTALMLAALHGQVSVVQEILSIAPEARMAKDKEGGTAIHHAFLYGEEECVKILIKHGADINELDFNGDTPLDWLRTNEDLDDRVKLEHRAIFKEMDAKVGKSLKRAQQRSEEEGIRTRSPVIAKSRKRYLLFKRH